MFQFFQDLKKLNSLHIHFQEIELPRIKMKKLSTFTFYFLHTNEILHYRKIGIVEILVKNKFK